jgi:PhnB protein
MNSLVPSLAVANIEESVRFYTEVLGFDVLFTLPGADGSLAHASVGRGEASVMFGKLDPASAHDQGALGKGVVLYCTVDGNEDIDDYYRRVKDAGATVAQEPTDQFWGHRDWGIADPDGYLIFVSKVTRTISAEEMQETMLAGAPA